MDEIKKINLEALSANYLLAMRNMLERELKQWAEIEGKKIAERIAMEAATSIQFHAAKRGETLTISVEFK